MAIEPPQLRRNRAPGDSVEGNRPMPPEVSFIVCTRNRAASLEGCLHSIEAACQSLPATRAELVVVDNGSTDDTAQVMARLAAKAEIPVSVVEEPRRGLAAARNAGLAHAHGRFLVFIDDDCKVDRDYLRDLERHYLAGAQPLIRGGRVEIGAPGDLPFTIKLSPFVERLSRDVHPGGFVLGCNFTMHREVAARVGRFDERLGAGTSLRSAEDTDYVVRASLLGIPVEYVPDMAVFHYHGRTTRRAIKALHRGYSLGNGALLAKHLRDAPWLLRHFGWTVRAALRELWGGPRFHAELRLSHWPIVVMNLLGALKFVFRLRRRPRVRDKELRRERVPAKVWQE